MEYLALGVVIGVLWVAVGRLSEIRDHLQRANGHLERVNVQLALVLTAARLQNKPFDAAMLAQEIDCFGGKGVAR